MNPNPQPRPASLSDPIRGLVVVGTDTGVGKTAVACALLRESLNRGHRLIPFKPAETGAAPTPDDAVALHAAAGRPVPADLVCLYPLALPAAPQVAAKQAGVTISLERILERARHLAARGDGLLVETAGGLLVPYAPGLTGADLAAHLDLPVLLVARTALGTVNHTALSVNELRRRDLRLAGLILVETLADRQPHEPGNSALIEQLTGVRALATLPYLSSPTGASGQPPDPDRLARALVRALPDSELARLLGLATGTVAAAAAPRLD
jgi:dethiobiotin synthetase